MEYTTLKEFYPYYLSEHSNGICRTLHFIGTTIVIISFIAFLATLNLKYLAICPIAGYFFAWIGHFIFEKNRPATFKYPLKSLASDFIMYWEMLSFQLPFSGELK